MSQFEWQGIERLPPQMKWFMVSRLIGARPFEKGKEPLNTVKTLQNERNKIVHPKAMQLNQDIIIKDKNGKLERDVPLDHEDHELKDGDHVYVGYGHLLDKYNHSTAKKSVRRSIGAIIELRDCCEYHQLEWLNDLIDEIK
ncbi:MAG: hypothetical protein GWN01_06790, partial [Nitrosopumilaceae archaeon]|nr:hypothetical protein [Nitrosopumilaceae archaeon]NIU87027.1 hypothetical protein [Nitrosopumilaceae archaeon]NIX61242.1 hypothetical protein [Nitrosopumilaceae archaeon]